MSLITGLHHVTAIAADPQANLDFYSGLLGMRLVKRTVNQDVPDTYHLFYADGEGHPGTDLTFFPWPDMAPGRNGTGLATEVGLAVPSGSLDYWSERLSRSDVAGVRSELRFGERALLLSDVHGLGLALVETGDEREFTPWTGGQVPARHQVRGLHSVRLWQRQLEPTERTSFGRSALPRSPRRAAGIAGPLAPVAPAPSWTCGKCPPNSGASGDPAWCTMWPGGCRTTAPSWPPAQRSRARALSRPR